MMRSSGAQLGCRILCMCSGDVETSPMLLQRSLLCHSHMVVVQIPPRPGSLICAKYYYSTAFRSHNAYTLGDR